MVHRNKSHVNSIMLDYIRQRVIFSTCQLRITPNKEIEMQTKTYTVKGNRTPADVVACNDEILETGYTLEEAKLAAISYQRDFKYAAAWIEEELGKPAPRPEPRITRS